MTSFVAISVFLSDPFLPSIVVASSSTRYLLPLRCVVKSDVVVWCGVVWCGVGDVKRCVAVEYAPH